MAKRKRIPSKTVDKVLIQSQRRCCLCLMWDADDQRKEGQIAHIDRNNENNAEENLAYLCLDHHNEYDTVPKQTKRLQPAEVREAKRQLLDCLAKDENSPATLTLTINRDFQSFSADKQSKFMSLLCEAAEIGGEVRVVKSSPGSVKLTLELSSADLARLGKAFDDGKLSALDVKRISLSAFSECEVLFEDAYVGSFCPIVVSKEQTKEAINAPTISAFYSLGRRVENWAEAAWGIFVRVVPKKDSDHAYSIVVLAANSGLSNDPRRQRGPTASMGYRVHCSFRIYHREVPHRYDWNPLDILRAFLDRFGVRFALFDSTETRLLFGKSVRVSREQDQWINAGQIGFLMRHIDPPKKVFNVGLFGRRRAQGDSFAEFVLSVDVPAYAKSLAEHGIDVPSKFFHA